MSFFLSQSDERFASVIWDIRTHEPATYCVDKMMFHTPVVSDFRLTQVVFGCVGVAKA